MPVRYLSPPHSVFTPSFLFPLPFIFAFPSYFISFPTGKISYLKTPLSLFAHFPLLRFLPSLNRIHFYRHTHRLAFKISYLKTQLSLFARFPLLRFLPSHNRIHFYRHTHRLAFNTYFRTSSVFLSARPTFAKKLRVGEESYAPTSKRAFSALFKVETCGQRSYRLRCVAERQSSRRLARVQGALIMSRASFPRKSCSL